MEEDDLIDYIETDRQTMLDFHGQYTFLSDGVKLSLFETEQLIGLTIHPITGLPLKAHEIQYIKFHHECYLYTKDMILTPETLSSFFLWYDESRKSGESVPDLRLSPQTAEAFKIVRFYLTATDFQSHFREFNPTDSEQEKYERDLGEKALRTGAINGSWLLRHSSWNRPVTQEAIELLRKSGTRYYALSVINENAQIGHILLSYSVGLGWKHREDIFPCFLDCLEDILRRYNIEYGKRIPKYTQ